MRYVLVVLSFLTLFSCHYKEQSQLARSQNSSGLLGLIDMSESDVDYAYKDVNTPPPLANQEVAQKIIKNATLRFETQDLEKTRLQVLTAIKKADGYVQNDNSGKDYNQLYQQLTVRIPSKNFQQTIDDIAQGVAYFDERTISQRDVTEEFIDLNARLKAKRALENRYLDLLNKAVNVKEMLEIERELSQIREEIEAKEGRLNYLNNQVSSSTLYIHFYKVTSDQGITQSFGSKITNALKSGWNGISVFFLGLLHIWPFLILLGIGTFFAHKKLKEKKKK